MAVNYTSNYTYDDYLKRARELGLENGLSGSDGILAKNNPDAGISILNYQNDYKNATTDEAKAIAHAGAEGIRSQYGGYSGGEDGSKYYLNEPSPVNYEMEEYQNPYEDRINSVLDTLMNRDKYSYDPNQDMGYQASKKAYLREADRSSEDTMGQYAAMTGGMPSTAAVSAANQAANYQKSQLNDKLSEYMDKDYQKYVDDIGLNKDMLTQLQSLNADNFDRFKDQRDTGYQQWVDDLNFKTDKQNTADNLKLNQDAADLDKQAYNDGKGNDLIANLLDYFNMTDSEEARKKLMELLGISA